MQNYQACKDLRVNRFCDDSTHVMYSEACLIQIQYVKIQALVIIDYIHDMCLPHV